MRQLGTTSLVLVRATIKVPDDHFRVLFGDHRPYLSQYLVCTLNAVDTSGNYSKYLLA